MSVTRRQFLEALVSAPAAFAILSTLPPLDDKQIPAEPITMNASPDHRHVVMTVEAVNDLVDVTTFGDMNRRYAVGSTHYYVNGLETTKEGYEDAIRQIKEATV